MEAFLTPMLQRHFPELDFLIVVHEGKSDLQQSVSRKIPRWNVPNDHIIILHDNDRGDCVSLKKKLQNLCGISPGSGSPKNLKIRIVIQELEAWYFGQPEKTAQALGLRKRLKHHANPDTLVKPSNLLRKSFPDFQKVSHAAILGNELTLESSSTSFRAFWSAVKELTKSPD
jgi:hypothetical protein